MENARSTDGSVLHKAKKAGISEALEDTTAEGVLVQAVKSIWKGSWSPERSEQNANVSAEVESINQSLERMDTADSSMFN